MAKSKIIKDLANGIIDTQTALKRAKVLFSDLQNEDLLKWVNSELVGYEKVEDLPDYRIIEGTLFGSYFKGSMSQHMKWTNVSIPLGKMPEDIKAALLNVYFYDGIDALKGLAKKAEGNEGQLGKSISADTFPIINKYNNDPYMIITSACSTIGSHNITNIISIVENRLLDALLLLEKEFGCLDELDLSYSEKTEVEIENIARKVAVIIYNDNSIKIGNGNKIEKSSIT